MRKRQSSMSRYCRDGDCRCALILLLLGTLATARAQPSAQHDTADLTLAGFLHRVLERNESVQVKLLEMEARRRQAHGESGIFEPELFGSASREATKQENTVEQQAGLQYLPVYEEENNIYQGGLEALVPTGAKVRLGYTLSDLRNSLQQTATGILRGATNGEFQTFVGVSLTQPLLKNRGAAATMAGIRIAALSSDLAFQEYRRQLMITVGTAEASYWNLYLAQEQVRFFEESVATAEKILKDNHTRLESGKGSQLEVLEAEAGLALRRSKLGEARQSLYETVSHILSLCSQTRGASTNTVRAVDHPQFKELEPGFSAIWKSACDSNPDFLMQQQKVMQEGVRLGYARNQRLPELNLKGSYGLNGLGETPDLAWTDIQARGFPSWSVGVELRVPVAGGIKVASELAAARLRLRAAQLALREVETQIANSISTAIHKIRSSRDNVESYRTMAGFNQNLLDSALARLAVGRMESRRVLEIEAELFESKNSVVEAGVQHQRALLELELLGGAVLKSRNLDLTQSELGALTGALARKGGFTDEEYAGFIRDLQAEYRHQAVLALIQDTPAQKKARDALDKITRSQAGWPATNEPPAVANPMTTDALRDALRRRLQESSP